MRRPRPRGWTTSGGAQLLCRDGSECDDDEQQNELLHVADDSPSLTSSPEVSERLVGSPAFKAGGRSDPATAGSIPVHLRHVHSGGRGCRYTASTTPRTSEAGKLDREGGAGAGVAARVAGARHCPGLALGAARP